jgi:chemotaxis protein CheD
MDGQTGRNGLEVEPRAVAPIPIQPRNIDEAIIVGVGEYRTINGPGKLACIGLGSCVAIAIYDIQSKIGGLAHAMLPRYAEGRDKVNAEKYADSAIMLMVDDLIEMGAVKSRLRAKIAGGAHMFSFLSSGTLNIGERNCKAAKETLKGEKIRLVGEHLGGTRGRTVIFNTADGSYRIQMGKDILEI